LLAGDSKFRQKDNDFLITKWTTQDGLPQNTITSIFQTRDGYLWIGTFGGLARFDGVKFTVFDSANTPELTSNRILSIYEDTWDRLWIGTETGEVFRFSAGQFKKIDTGIMPLRKAVWGIEQDKDRNLLISSESGLEKLKFDDKGEIVPGLGIIVSRERCNRFAKQPDGTIWVRVQNDFFAVQDGQLISAREKGISLPETLLRIQFASDGDLIVGSGESLGSYKKGEYRKFLNIDPKVHQNSYAIASVGGTTWLQQADELFELGGAGKARHSLEGYVVGGSSLIFSDRAGNLWLGTNFDGLVRLTRKRIQLLSDLIEKELFNAYAILEDSEGTVWLGGTEPLRFRDGKVEKFPELPENESFLAVKSLALSSKGTIWFGTTDGLYGYSGEVVPVEEFRGKIIDCLYFDSAGFLWAGGPEGLWRYGKGKFEHFTMKKGLADNRVSFITQAKDGTIWIATAGGISRFNDGEFNNLSVKDGLSSNYVREIVEDEDGTFWIGTYGGGLNRIRNGTIKIVMGANGLHDNFISRILRDDQGRFWLLGNQGVFAVDRKELNDVADGVKDALTGALFGVSDGMTSDEASGGHQPAGIRTNDGKLWFPMIRDIVIIDPKNLGGTPPKVIIESVTAGAAKPQTGPVRQAYDTKKVFRLGSGERKMKIDYTALTFTGPEKLRFFYQMEGIDEYFVDAGTKRTALYPFLPAGNYRFRVKALTANGIWSENEAAFLITVEKAFWQTWWFSLLLAAAFIASILLIYRWQIRESEKRDLRRLEFSKRLINAHESERQRIAAELHDGLGQNLLLIKNWALLGQRKSSEEDQVRAKFGQISETASVALEETRSIVKNLTPQSLRRFGFTEALTNMLEQIENSTGVVFEQRIDNIDGILPDESELSVYRIIQECMNNVIKHSESPRGTIQVSFRNGELRVIIEDFGKGLDDDSALENRPGAFGIRSVNERARLLGGSFTIESRKGEGTRVLLRIPNISAESNTNTNS
jgi:signal transduction histidine kinase/ligand-binding sensor domain-containing protein